MSASGDYSTMIQDIKVSANLGRKELFELGRRGPYYRYVNFPVEDSGAAALEGENNVNESNRPNENPARQDGSRGDGGHREGC